MITRGRVKREPVFPSVAKNMPEYRKNAFKITRRKDKKERKDPST